MHSKTTALLRRPFRWAVVAGLLGAACTFQGPQALAGPKGKITVRPLGDLRLTIDGNISDWPLDQFKKVVEQPLFPDGQNADTTSATGDHLVFDRNRIGRFNDTQENAWQDGDNDFGVTLYFAYDSKYLYLLALHIDDVLRDDRDTSDFGATGFNNDGFEFFLDGKADSADCIAEDVFPAIDLVEPNTDDMQITVAINSKFKPTGSPADVLGARQSVERAGNLDLIGPEKGGPGGIYRDILDALGGPDIAAKKYADLRAAGARNPELAAKPSVQFSGYAIEMRVPFDTRLGNFRPDHHVGFELFWRDVDTDEDPGQGGGNISWASWAQSTTVDCRPDPKPALFSAANWGELVFDKSDFLGPPPVHGGPKGEIVVRPLGDTTITIDGDISDWPLAKFGNAAEQPPFPEGQKADATSARGDHLVFDRNRIGRFNGTLQDAWQAGANDFGATIYFAYEPQFLYLLAVYIDDKLRMERDITEFGSTGFLNDGFEFLLDTKGDSWDCASEVLFPGFDEQDPNKDDFQATVAINAMFKPAGSPDNVLGARQTVERGGNPALIGPNKGGPGGLYRDTLDGLGGPDIGARSYADLRAAGARNPEVLANPGTLYSGYAIEMRIPFKNVPGFTPDHNMGFEIFWRDVDEDDDPGQGGGNISWASWAQSTEVPCDNPRASLFNTGNWGHLTFNTDNPLSGPAVRPRLSFERTGSKLRFTWTDSAALFESATSLAGSWSTITNAASSFEQDTTADPQRYFRLRRP